MCIPLVILFTVNVLEIMMSLITLNVRENCLDFWIKLFAVIDSPILEEKPSEIAFHSQIEFWKLKIALTLTLLLKMQCTKGLNPTSIHTLCICYHGGRHFTDVFYYANIKRVIKWLNNWSYGRRNVNDFLGLGELGGRSGSMQTIRLCWRSSYISIL